MSGLSRNRLVLTKGTIPWRRAKHTRAHIYTTHYTILVSMPLAMQDQATAILDYYSATILLLLLLLPLFIPLPKGGKTARTTL